MNIKKIINLGIMICAGVMLTSCGIKISTDKKLMTKRIEVSGTFNQIETTGITDVTYTQGDPDIILKAPEALMEKIIIRVKDGRLTVGNKEEQLNQIIGSATLVVSYPSIDCFITSGTGDIDIKASDVSKLTLKTYGTGDIECEKVKCDNILAETAGTGDIEIESLKCDSAFFYSYGTGDLDISGITSNFIDAATQGTGDITLKGRTKFLKEFAGGTGDIEKKQLIIK